MKNIFTQCFSIEEADHLGHFLMSRGYEGVQNDSYRYCKLSIERALIDNEKHNRVYIYVGVNGCQIVVGRNKKQMRHISEINLCILGLCLLFPIRFLNQLREFTLLHILPRCCKVEFESSLNNFIHGKLEQY